MDVPQSLSLLVHKLRLENVYCFAVDITDLLFVYAVCSTYEMISTSKSVQ